MTKTWHVNKEDVEMGRVVGKPFVRISPPCECGCSLKHFVSVSNGSMGITFEMSPEDWKNMLDQLSQGNSICIEEG